MANAHKAARSTGLCRTWPNMVGSESVRGGECEVSGGNNPDYTTILPFTCLQGGPMDYMPGISVTKLSEWSDNTSFIRSTLAGQLALYVTIYGPLQVIADLPEHYEKYDDTFQFIQNVVVDQDDSKYLEAKPGGYITTAHKAKGTDSWLIGGRCDKSGHKGVIGLGPLDKDKKCRRMIYANVKNTHYDHNPQTYAITHKAMERGDVLEINQVSGGGFTVPPMT